MLYSRDIPEGRGYDVVVCGGGPAGTAAALSARREGASVLLLEGQAQLGGMATSGLVSHWLGGRTEPGEWVVGGLFRSLVEAAVERGLAILPVLTRGRRYQPHGWLPWFVHGVPLDPFATAALLDETLAEAGVDVLLETQLLDAAVRDGRITHVIAQNKSGLCAWPGRAFVDATGDADIAAFAGCAVQAGREEDGLMTPASLTFHLCGVDHEALWRHIEENRCPKFRETIDRLRERGDWPFPYDIFISVQLVQQDVAMINTMRLPGVNGLDASSRSRALAEGRRQVGRLLGLLREHFPGFGQAEVKAVASLLGIRETRRIVADRRLAVAELAGGEVPADTIGFSMYGWDLPDPLRPSHQPMVDESGGGYVSRVKKGPSTPIPFGVMVPLGVSNLLCPGRAVSVERDVLGPLRVMAPCMAMGEACGTAGAWSAGQGGAVAAVDVEALRGRLRDCGAIVDADALPEIPPRVDP